MKPNRNDKAVGYAFSLSRGIYYQKAHGDAVRRSRYGTKPLMVFLLTIRQSVDRQLKITPLERPA